MNLEHFQLPSLSIERFQVSDVLRCLFHTILFNRALGCITPTEMRCEVMDIDYCRVNDNAIQKTVEATLTTFLALLEQNGESAGHACLAFFSTSLTKTWLSTKEEKRHWERWVIPITLTSGRGSIALSSHERARAAHETQKSIRDAILYIVRVVNEKKDHIPPIKAKGKNGANVCYPFEITFTAGAGGKHDGSDGSSWGIQTFKRMLKQGPPMLMKN